MHLVLIRDSEVKWMLGSVMPWMGLHRVKLAEEPEYKGKYPDIWAQGETITVTPEWASQGSRERKKRLLHESFHIMGLPHMPSKGYYSRPDKDTFSPKGIKALSKGVGMRQFLRESGILMEF